MEFQLLRRVQWNDAVLRRNWGARPSRSLGGASRAAFRFDETSTQRLAPEPGVQSARASHDVFSETPNTARETRALPGKSPSSSRSEALSCLDQKLVAIQTQSDALHWDWRKPLRRGALKRLPTIDADPVAKGSVWTLISCRTAPPPLILACLLSLSWRRLNVVWPKACLLWLGEVAEWPNAAVC
jgi:hypothetical protein